MSRLLLPLAVSAAAFATGWWLAPASRVLHSDPDISPSSPSPATAATSGVPKAGSLLPATGLARRSALLLKTEVRDPAAIRRLFEGPPLETPEIFRLAKIWAEQDPAGLWDWLNHGGRERMKNVDLTGVVFTAWLERDALGALAAYRRIGSQFRWEAARTLLQPLLGDDETMRQKVLPFLDELAADCGGTLHIHEDAPGNVARLMKLPASPGRDSLLAHVARFWVDSDWKAASTWAATLTEPTKSKVTESLVRAAFHPNIRINYTTTDKPASYTEAGCFAWAQQWFRTEASPELRQKLGGQFVSTLAAKDPAAALDWATENLSARPLTKAIEKVVEEQVREDPAAARALVEGLPPGGMKQRAAFGAVGSPTPESVNWLIGQADPDNLQDWYQLAGNWAFQDPAAYKKYLETADPAVLPGHLINGGLNNLIRKDAAGTLDWTLRTQKPATTGSALQTWSRTDAPAAALWLKDHATAPLNPKSVETLANRYLQHTPTDAVDWAATLPAGPTRDAALTSLRKNLDSNTTLKPETRDALKASLAKP